MKLSRLFVAGLMLWSLSARAAAPAPKLQIVATPNPNVFPLLIALHDNPELPVSLVPVKDSAGIIAAFDHGADGLLAMTYTIAKMASGDSVPDLSLEGVYFWRGFFEMTLTAAHSFKDLQGKGLIVSGPVSGGNGGGPDLFFQAALLREGLFPEDFSVCYLPVMQGLKLLESGKPMNSVKSCQGAQPASGILLVEPAASGFKLKSSMPFGPGKSVSRGIDLQKLFTGYTEWKADELPHGGFAIRRDVLADPVKDRQYQAFVRAYRAAIDKLNHSDGMFSRLQLGHIISEGIGKYFGQYKMELPTIVVARAIKNGEMRFRDDRALPAIQPDLDKFLKEVLNTQSLPGDFYLKE